MSAERFTVVTIAAGQARPYADSIYHYRVTIEWQGLIGYKDKTSPFVPRPQLDRSIVDRIILGLCGPFEVNPIDPFARNLTRCEMVEPGVWDVVVVEKYCD